MNRKVLYVHGAQPLGATADVLASEFDVALAPSGTVALELGRTGGPFAVVISEAEAGGMSGRALLSAFRDRWPETQGILVGAEGASEQFRALAQAPELDELLDATRSALLRAHLNDFEGFSFDELELTRGALLELTEALESRLDERMLCLRALGELAANISAAESLGQVACIAAETVSETFGGCGVELVLDDGDEQSEETGARSGPDLSERVFRLPLVSGEQHLGELRIDRASHPRGHIGSAHRQFLESVAATAAGAAAHQIRRLERDEAQHATIMGLARLAEYRDDETGKHLERVSQFCRTIALALRRNPKYTAVIDDDFVDDIDRSAPLHDIGKVGIADSILLKPGKLTDDEWVEMRKHPTIGMETMRPLVERNGAKSYLHMGMEIAWCHHEKWNGSGYPRGLAGDTIPLSARILSLADCYDALTTRRPYKDPWPHEKAVEYVTEQSGSHFDPDVVAAFMADIAAVDEIRQRLADAALLAE